MLAIDRKSDAYLYQQVVDWITDSVRTGTLKPGDRLPSLRKMSARLGISIPTVKQAYIELERLGKVEARPQSGFYVRPKYNHPLAFKRGPQRHFKPVNVVCRNLIESVFEGAHLPGVTPLGIANPVMARSPSLSLNRAVRRVMARGKQGAIQYSPMNGYPELRRQLAYRYLDQGVSLDPEEVIITNGAQEALAIALQCVARPGDVIAVESPTFFGVLELIESLGMLALEVCTCPQDGVWLEGLRKALRDFPVRACLFASSINNPLGSRMPESNRAELVTLLEEHEIPLIEDDVYGELFF